MFSLYYQIANALLRGRASVTEYTDEAVHDPKVLELCKKVQLKITPEYERPGTFNKTRLEIVTKRGTFSQDNEYQKGHPKNPIDWEGHIQKMWDYNAMVAKPISRENLEKMVEMLKDLEKVDDVTRIVELMVG
jgi:2-methylcitrate dehydratase PrpD